MAAFIRIAQDASIAQGKARIRGTRITVEAILSDLGAGSTMEALLDDYPSLQRADLLEALRYAACLAAEREVELARA